MAAAAFLNQLPEVPKAELPSDTCMICLCPYGTTEGNEEVGEVAIRLPCNHVMGSKCISTWLSPDHEMRNSTCPYCRCKFFDVYPDNRDPFWASFEAASGQESNNNRPFESVQASLRTSMVAAALLMDEMEETQDHFDRAHQGDEFFRDDPNHPSLTRLRRSYDVASRQLEEYYEILKAYYHGEVPPPLSQSEETVPLHTRTAGQGLESSPVGTRAFVPPTLEAARAITRFVLSDQAQSRSIQGPQPSAPVQGTFGPAAQRPEFLQPPGRQDFVPHNSASPHPQTQITISNDRSLISHAQVSRSPSHHVSTTERPNQVSAPPFQNSNAIPNEQNPTSADRIPRRPPPRSNSITLAAPSRQRRNPPIHASTLRPQRPSPRLRPRRSDARTILPERRMGTRYSARISQMRSQDSQRRRRD